MYIYIPTSLCSHWEEIPSQLRELTQLKIRVFFSAKIFFSIIHDSTASIAMENDGSVKGTKNVAEEQEC